MPVKSGLCLNMIVKNEARVIERAIASARPYITSWAISDTGSTDGTQDIIKNALADIPGKLIERPWKSFEHNRNEALLLAEPMAGHILILDADEMLEVDGNLDPNGLKADSYRIRKIRGPFSYYVPNIIKSGLGWRWIGIIHEYLHSDAERETVHLDHVRIESPPDGARSQSRDTYRHDAQILESALIDEPDNARYVFYLANAYRDCGDLDRAILNYQRRKAMGGWEEELFVAAWRLAECKLARGDDWEGCLAAFFRAHERDPSRAEPLFIAGRAAAKRGDWATAYMILSRAAAIPHPGQVRHLIMEDIYEYRALLDAGVAAHQLGLYEEAIALNDRLIARTNVPVFWCTKAKKNRASSRKAAQLGQVSLKSGIQHP